MPTIIRFVTTLVILGALFGVAVFALGNFVQPRQRELTIRIPPSRLEPRPAPRPPAPVPAPPTAPAGDAGSNAGAVAQ